MAYLEKEQTRSLMDSVSELTDEQKRETLPRRLEYFVSQLDEYDSEHAYDQEIEEIFNLSDIGIREALLDYEKRDKIRFFLEGVRTDTLHDNIRIWATQLADEVYAMRVINLTKVGDFYEAYDDSARTLAEMFQLAISKKKVENSEYDTVGFPSSMLQRYEAELTAKGIYVFHENAPQETERLLTVSRELARDMFLDGTTVYLYDGEKHTEVTDTADIDGHDGYFQIINPEHTKAIQDRADSMTDEEKEDFIASMEISVDYGDDVP